MAAQIKYDFTASMWQEDAPGAWVFVTLPTAISTEIRENLKWQEEGWGRMKAAVKIGETTWKTAIWYDSKQKTYLLPIKASIRKKAGLKLDELVAVSLFI